MQTSLSNLLTTKPWLLADGATGTNLFDMGLQSGDAPELWNLDRPDAIKKLYSLWEEAGSDIILTNSFGGNEFRLKLHKAENQVSEINKAAANLAKQVVDASDRTIVIGGSIGPTGELMFPLGTLTHEAAVSAFENQYSALIEGGIDVLWIETMSSREELNAAIQAARNLNFPYVATLSFDTNGKTMMGVAPQEIVKDAQALGTSAIGANCGVGPAELVAIISQMSEAANQDTILIAKGNCGIPEFIDGEVRYSGTPELMAQYATLAVDAGARIVGGCCGTTKEHIVAMRNALDRHVKGKTPSLETLQALGTISSGAMGEAAPSGRRRRRR